MPKQQESKIPHTDCTNLLGSLRDDEKALERQGDCHYALRLFVSGLTERSAQAIANVRSVCQEQLAGRYDLEVIDVSQHPSLAQSEHIVATPTLIKRQPLPLRRLVGGLSDTKRVLAGLGLKVDAQEPE